MRGFYERAEFWDHTTIGEIEIVEINQLAAILEKSGHTVDYYELFYKNKNEKDVNQIFTSNNYDVVAIFTEYDSLINAAKIAMKAKRLLTNCTVISFGYYTISNYEKILKIAANIDMGIVSLDDATFLNFVNCLEEKKDVSAIAGVAYRDKDRNVICNACDAHYENISLPWARRLEDNIFSAEIRTINGCRSQCIFCEIANARKNLNFHDIRMRDVEDVINEMEYLQNNKGTKCIKFADETFFLYSAERREWLVRFLELYKQRNLHLRMGGNARVVDILKLKDLLPELRSIGFDEILIGVENLVQSKLDFYRKGSTVEQNLEAFHFMDELGINIGVGFILFDPLVGVEEIKENLTKLLEHNFYTHVLGAASSYPFPIDAIVSIVANSPLYTMCEENDLITRENWYGYNFKDAKVEEFRDVLTEWNESCPVWDSLVFKCVTTLADNNEGAKKDREYRIAANMIKRVNLEEMIKMCDLILSDIPYDRTTFINEWQNRKTEAYFTLEELERDKKYE